jgi:signal transduction histidine kinase
MKFIISQTAKAGDRIDVIRDFAAIEDAHQEAVNAVDLVKECLAGAKVILDENQMQLHTDFSISGSPVITGQPKQLEIVFTNLFKNAAEATSAARPDPAHRHLWVKIQTKGDYLQIVVRDSGLGVKKEDQPRLFEKHFTTKGSAGTGIGLYFSHQIVVAHGGRMTFENRENEGAEFTVSLPKAA